MSRTPLARGPQGATRLSPEDSRLLAKWTDKHGYDGAAKCLGVSPTLVYKLSHEGVATSLAGKHLSDALHAAEQALMHKLTNEQ